MLVNILALTVFCVPWNYKISWIKSLYYWAEKICSSGEKFRFQSKRYLQSYLSWLLWRLRWKIWSQFSYKIKLTCFLWRSTNVSAPIKMWLHITYTIDLLRLPDIDASTTGISNKQHFVNAVNAFMFWTPDVTVPNCYF